MGATTHEPPEVFCSCGYYATKSPQGPLTIIRQFLSNEWQAVYRLNLDTWPRFGMVLSQVYLWGKMIEHELGYRAQFCYPKTVLTDSRQETARLAGIYECQEETSCTWEELFGNSELSLYESQLALLNAVPPSYLPLSSSTFLGIDDRSSSLKMFGPAISPANSPAKPTSNRSVAKPLQAMVQHKEEVASSDFWKRI